MAGRPIDEKIVVMKLDNSDFKRKALDTTGLMGKLKDSLNRIPGVNLGKTVTDLNGINAAVGNTNLGGLSTAIQGVGTQFSAMSVIATTALATIVNKAVNAGTSLAKSLSMDQVTSGFQEYELKMGSIQTILANTSKHGTTLKDVTRNFEELNTYADKTIYSFGDMTKNIGLFTNAGLKLDESTSMIKGFSNMAAASGTNSERAAGAAYQLSQGLSSGYIMTMDWMSLTNAGMGNDNMKNDLIALGQEMGTLDRTTDDTLKNWKEALSDDKWLTTDVMSTYLQTMAGDIGKAELLTLGLSEAQADLMINNAKMGEDAATKVRTFTQLMDTLKESIGSGWATTFETVLGDFNEATELFSKISGNLGEAVGKSNDARNNFLKTVANGDGFTNIFEGFMNATKPVVQILSLIKTAFRMVFPPTSAANVIKITEAFKKFTEGLLLGPAAITQLTNIFRGLFSIFSTAWEIVKRLTAAFVNLIPEGSGGGILDIIEKVANMSTAFNKSVKEGNGLTDFIDGMGKAFGKVGDFLGTIGAGVKDFSGTLGKAIDWIKDKLAPVGDYIKEAMGGSIGDEAVGAGVLVALFAIIKKIQGFFDGGEFTIFESLGEMVDGIKDTFGGIGDAVNNFATSIKYVNLILIAVAIGILAASLKILEGIDAEDIGKGITALALALGVMIAGMVLMSKFNVTGGITAAITLIALAAAVTIMASALKKISDLDPKELATGIGGLAAIVASLSLALIAISKFGGKISVGSIQLLALAGAVIILAQAVKTMSEIKPGELFTAIGALALIFASLALFLKVVDKTKFNIGSALGILVIAAAIKVMVSGINDIALIKVENLVKGLATITLILAAIALFAKVAGGPQMALAGVGLLLVAAGINALVGPITSFSKMSWEELAKGMAAMAVSLAILAGAAYLMTGGIVGALGVVAMAYALQMLVVPIEAFGKMTWGQIGKGLGTVALALALVAAAAVLLTPAVPSMLAFGAAVLLIGVAMLAAGLGMSLFGAGLITLATLTAGSVAAIVSALSLLIAGLGTLIIQVVDFVVKIGLALLDGLAALIPRLVEVGWQIVMAIVTGLDKNMPQLIEKGGSMIVKFLNGMSEQLPQIVAAAANLMDQLALAVQENSGKFTNAWLDIMSEVALIMVAAGTATIDALWGWIPGVSEKAKEIGKTAEVGIKEAFDAQKVAVDKGTEFSTGLSSTSGIANSAGNIVGASGIDGIVANSMNPIGIGLGTDFSGGLASTSGAALNAGTGIANSSESGASTANLNPFGLGAGSGFASSLMSTAGKALTSGTGVANASESGASTVNLDPFGLGAGSGFASSILSTSGAAKSAGTGIANSSENGASTANGAPIGSKFGTDYSGAVASKAGAARSSASGLARGAKTGAQEVEGNPIGSNFGSGFAAGIAGQVGSVARAAANLASVAASKMRGILDIRSPSRVTKKIGNQTGDGFAKGIEAKKKAAEEAAKKVAEAAAKSFAYSKGFIDDQKNYNHIGLTQELNAWERVQKRYKQGTEERKEADKEVYRLKNEINKKLIELNDEYTNKVQASNQKLIADEKALNDEYNNSVKERAKSIAGFTGLFDKVAEGSKVTGTQLLDNLKGQLTTITDWKNDIQELSGRGMYQGLVDELTEMGPKAAAEISVLNTMTDAQLKEYSQIWGEKNRLANDEATRELEGLKKTTSTKITELRKATAIELESYRKEWAAKISEIRYGTSREFVALGTTMTTIGKNAIQGMILGMGSMSGPLAKQSKSLSDSIVRTIKASLQIKSPSRVAEGLGSFFGQGMANGIAKQKDSVLQSSKQLAVTAKDSINQFISSFDPTPEDNEIHFKAVVDYDGFNPGVGRMPVNLVPDTSATSGLVTATKAQFRQNADKFRGESVDKSVRNDYKYDIHVNANGTMSRPEVRKLAMTIRDEIKNQDDRSRMSRGEGVAF